MTFECLCVCKSVYVYLSVRVIVDVALREHCLNGLGLEIQL